MADFPNAVNPFSGASDPQHSPVEPVPSKFAAAVNPFQSPVVEPEQQVAEAEPIKYAAARKALMKKRSEASSSEEAAKIDQQLYKLDERNANERTGTIPEALDKLNAPLRAHKKLWSDDENIWFDYDPENMSPEAYAAINTGLDLVGDPLMYVGGALAKGSKAVPGAIASLSNYIPGFYSALRAGSLAKWAPAQAKAALAHVTSPMSRGMFREFNQTAPSNQRILGYLDDATDTRAVDKAVSQVQYTSGHIPKQTATEAPLRDSAERILDKSFMQSYTPNEGNALANAFRKWTGKTHKKTNQTVNKRRGELSAAEWDKVPANEIDPKDAEKFADHINKVVPSDNFVVKNPTTKETGGHFNDVVYHNPANNILKKAWEKISTGTGESTTVDLKALSAFLNENRAKDIARIRKGTAGAPNPYDGWKILEETDDALWIVGSRKGSAITEGGTGWLMKVDSKGGTSTVMFDKHDFFEKLGAEALVPGKLVAVSPIMQHNVKNLGKPMRASVRDSSGNVVKEIGPKGRPVAVKQDLTPSLEYQQVQPRPNRTFKQNLFDYANNAPTPSDFTLMRESANMAGEGMLANRITAGRDRATDK